jgi:hypothetical protein
MALDSVLSESATASAHLAGAEAGNRNTPITVRASAANMSLGKGRRSEIGHKRTSDLSCTKRTCLSWEISETVRNYGQSYLLAECFFNSSTSDSRIRPICDAILASFSGSFTTSACSHSSLNRSRFCSRTERSPIGLRLRRIILQGRSACFYCVPDGSIRSAFSARSPRSASSNA